MKIITTNRSESKTVIWKGKEVLTGIYKYPVSEGIFLGTTDVEKDAVVDRKYHGGVDKACYLFSADVYPKWKGEYPDLDWNAGMFGENLTVEGLNEKHIFIGDQYRIGEALVEVSEPREPCYKLGIRFGTQQVLKSFIGQHQCGVYVRVLEPGRVQPEDTMVLIKRVQEDFSVARIFWLRYHAKVKDMQEVLKALQLASLASSAKKGLARRLVRV